jgi:hypothetical protein
MLGTLLLVVLVLLIAGSFPAWPHSRNWGYGPTGLLSVILVVIVVMALLGYLPFGPGRVAH